LKDLLKWADLAKKELAISETILSRRRSGKTYDFILENMPEHEAIETIFKYSDLLELPITNEIAQLMLELTEGNRNRRIRPKRNYK